MQALSSAQSNLRTRLLAEALRVDTQRATSLLTNPTAATTSQQQRASTLMAYEDGGKEGTGGREQMLASVLVAEQAGAHDEESRLLHTGEEAVAFFSRYGRSSYECVCVCVCVLEHL